MSITYSDLFIAGFWGPLLAITIERICNRRILDNSIVQNSSFPVFVGRSVLKSVFQGLNWGELGLELAEDFADVLSSHECAAF
jgi:hypothetical protein